MVVVGGMIEVSDITRKRSTFDSYEIEGTKLFVSGLKPGELVYPYGVSDHLLYYTNISRENIVCDFDNKDRLYQIFDMEAPYEISDLVQEIYPNVTKYIFYLSGIDDYYLHQTQFGLLLDDYFERENYASFNSYSLDVPFNIKDIELRKAKYIQDVSDNLFPSQLDGIKSVSNSVNIRGDSRPIKMLFLMDGTDRAIGLASSIDGIYWALENFTNLEGRIETLYMVEVDDRYLLYVSTRSRDQILCYSSYDLINWVNETVIFDASKDGDFSFIEYPIVFVDDDKFRMLFWRTSLNDFMMHGVHFAESFNGIKWNTSERLEWFLMDSSYHIYSYDKILPTDILIKNGEYVILGSVYMKKLGIEKKWYTGSISFENITQKTVMYRDFVYKDHVDSRMHSIHLVRDVESSGLRFIYVEEDGGLVFVGAASDHLGLEEYLELP